MTKTTHNDLDIMARTIYGEARGEGVDGMIAVANVIKNRTTFTKGAKSVCLAPYQFSCWNSSDPNKVIIENLGTETALYKSCLSIAKQVMAGDLPDNTNGATHYHTSVIRPYWADDSKITAVIGSHIFYKGV